MKIKHLSINAQLSLDDLDEAIRLSSENCSGKEFNDFAMNLIDSLLWRADAIGCSIDLSKRVKESIERV